MEKGCGKLGIRTRFPGEGVSRCMGLQGAPKTLRDFTPRVYVEMPRALQKSKENSTLLLVGLVV
jgi:hypothetical protein